MLFNKFIIVDNCYVNFTNFSNKYINFVSDLVDQICNFKSWETLKNEYHLDKECYFWMDAIDSCNPTNLETKNKWQRKKYWKKLSPNKKALE